MKKYIFPFLYTISICLIGIIPISILYYFNVTSDKINNILTATVSIISIFVGAYKISKEMKYKGIINGVIYFFIWFIILLFLSIIFKVGINISSIIYYLVLLLSSIIGAIAGKNVKTDDN